MKNFIFLLFLSLCTAVHAPAQVTLPPGMVFVHGGTFTMGCTPEQQPCILNFGPERLVRMKSFWIGVYEVTQGQWKIIMNNNPANFISCGLSCPIESVCFYDCITFCNRLSVQQGLMPCYYFDKTYNLVFDSLGTGIPIPLVGGYSKLDDIYFKPDANGYRLLTEAEWEYAARGGGGIQTKYSGSNNVDSVAWNFGNNVPSGTKPVGQKYPNLLGIYDMSGNVSEWCWDLPANYAPSPVDGSYTCKFIFIPSQGWIPVNGYTGWRLRGGAYNDSPVGSQVSYRQGGITCMDYRGFRLARNSD